MAVQEAAAQEISKEHEEVMKVQHAIERKLNLLLEKERIGLVAKKQKQIEERKEIEKQVNVESNQCSTFHSYNDLCEIDW